MAFGASRAPNAALGFWQWCRAAGAKPGRGGSPLPQMSVKGSLRELDSLKEPFTDLLIAAKPCYRGRSPPNPGKRGVRHPHRP
ncbi:hypothetical protein GCM10009565_94910 [Amycolatopsis albidoflavus]